MTRDDQELIAWLRERDAGCPVCGYNLRGVGSPACPECSSPLHLTVGSGDITFGPWLLAIVACALGLGFDGVVTVLIVVMLVVNPTMQPGPYFMLAAFAVIAAFCGGGVVHLARTRRSWSLPSRREQWRSAWGIFAFVGVGHVFFAGLLIVLIN